MQTHIDVSIPLLSGPVLNVVPVRFCDVAHCLNPFAFRASAEPPFGPRIEGGGRRLNPFAFRASAERARQPGLYIFHRLNPFAFRASAELQLLIDEHTGRRLNPFAFRASAERFCGAGSDAAGVSIPLLSGPVLNRLEQGNETRSHTVSIPLLSGPVLNAISRSTRPRKTRSQSLCFQGQC